VEKVSQRVHYGNIIIYRFYSTLRPSNREFGERYAEADGVR